MGRGEGKATDSMGWALENSYAHLPESLYSRQRPVPVRRPSMVVFNRSLAAYLGLDADVLEGEEGAEIFSGNRVPPGSQPLAQAYAGHQFGYLTMLGDGRAILLGEQVTPGGERLDIQLKGSGRTPFSRQGDGRAALGPMLREYIMSEALHALKVPTTRSLAVVSTGEPVYRETELAGAVLTRVASSHIRVGTFEYLAAKGEVESIRTLVDYTMRRHYADGLQFENPPLALLRAVMERQASLVARWLHIGFIHGVMNTDNVALSGETIDYGPCAFMDVYDPATVYSSIDRFGRYAFGNQPRIAQWNLARFAETLLPVLAVDPKNAVDLANGCLDSFEELFRREWLSGMRGKLGLFAAEDEDASLIQDLLTHMQQNRLDYTNTFRELSVAVEERRPLLEDESFSPWLARWRARLARQPEPAAASRELMRTRNPAIIPRNYRVEDALRAAVTQDDMRVMEQLLKVLANPFDDPVDPKYCKPPPPSAEPYRTYCGT